MASFLNIGDILMLSQLAWRIGCAFTSGRNGAPAEFQEIENELNSLTSALTLLAETLDEDSSIISKADQKTKDGVEKIIESCRQTLSNLDSFVVQYQEIKRSDSDSDGRVATRKSWRKILVRNYKTIWWTAEGGNIESLRNMLNMHMNSISLTMQALQSRSLSRLENTIEPMAAKVDDIHTTLNGDLNVKIDEIHHLMLSMAAMESTPRLSPGSPKSFAKRSLHEQPTDPRRAEVKPVKFSPPPDPPRDSSYTYPPYSNEKMPKPFDVHDDSQGLQVNPNSIQRAESWSQRPESWLVIPETHRLNSGDDTLPQYQQYRSPISNRNSVSSPGAGNTPVSRTQSEASRVSQATLPMLPPAAMPIDQERIAAIPPSSLPAKIIEQMISPDSELAPALQLKITTTDAEQAAFEKDLFTNAAVLCEARCTQVEYTVPHEENPLDLKMIQGSADCRLFLVTKRQKLSSGILRFSTSIWALSDDNCIRLQQELPDGEEVVPYTVWGNLKKIVIRVPTELKFYDTLHDAKPIDSAKTSWINYVLEDEGNSSAFQSALMGRSLVMSVKTNKTMRIHEGLMADTFSYQEQMCALENMRIWQDHETNSFMAMVHFTAHFREGYMAFFLNSSRDPIRVRDDGPKVVKIKGLKLEVPAKPLRTRTNSADSRRSPSNRPKDEKRSQIKGAKIEFTSEEDKRRFLEKVREVQGTFFAG